MKAIRYITKTQKGTRLRTYVGVNDAGTQAQYDLIKVGTPGTAGDLDGVVCRYGELVNPATLDAAGNAMGEATAHFGAKGTLVYQAYEVNLGTPIAADADYVHAVIALTADAQDIAVGITNPDICRNLTITGNAGGNAGDVVITGTDALGRALEETIALNGNATVRGAHAFATVTNIHLPAETHAGTDTITIGIGDMLGLPYRMDTNAVLRANLANTPEATAPTVTFDANDVSLNTVDLDSAYDGAKPVWVFGIRCDATVSSPINVNP